MGQNLDDWIPYFEYLTSASAGILAIAFLAFQVRSEIWRSHPLMHPVAATTLAELSTPVFFGLLFLMPSHPWELAGLLTGALGYLAMAWHMIALVVNRHAVQSFDRIQLTGVPITGLTFGLLLWWPSLQVKAGVALWMIFSGFIEAWLF